MDIPRTPQDKPLLRRRWLRLALAVLALLALLMAGLRARPSELSVRSSSLVIAAVERGPLTLNLRGSGSLLPSEVRWITTQAEGRVDRVEVQAGSRVKAGDMLLRLLNPQLLQKVEESRWSLQQAEAELRALQSSLDSSLLNQRASLQRAELALRSAELQWAADQELLKDGMVSKLAYQRSQFNVEQARQNLALERELLERGVGNGQAQRAAKQAAVARLAKALQRDQELADALTLRSPIDGIVQELALQPGQAVLPGASLAKVARADALYAEIQVQEAQARDLAPGLNASVDLRSGAADGVIAGVVSRVAPKVSNGVVKVDIQLLGALPRGARPDLSVDGTIELARLDDTLQVQRPAFSQGDSSAQVFRVGPDGMAERVPVQFGAAAVSRIVVKQGLKLGERIVVSDTSSWRLLERVSIQQ
ncbi:efflux RND transporter periplasmic adaptor subunit [Pelomonas sp. SE-A7]|uniref:efflux RND transporter periplasmic adaptor subunit n=1 Tax=Pelomonas sp. SE-A7 TaxID=3054953 RepID=UPI00259CB0B1|nr:efflux RND transporter periplasmic adaptor subunit [Pelomonas sp. SE-A7]MDM4765512.1 efflux RND transporter periplasmic adaptor subunit [Pelomonas sp. SE-A7]